MKFSGLLAAAFAFTAYASVIPAQAPPAVADVGHCLDCTVSAVLTTVTDLKATVDKELVSISTRTPFLTSVATPLRLILY